MQVGIQDREARLPVGAKWDETGRGGRGWTAVVLECQAAGHALQLQAPRCSRWTNSSRVPRPVETDKERMEGLVLVG